MNPKILAIGLAALCVSARGSDLIPVEDFARFPTHSDLRLSSDGKFCASLRADDGRNFIEFMDLSGGSVQKFDPGRAVTSRFASGELRSALRYHWLGSKRVIAEFTDGTAAFDRDGKNWIPLSGPMAAIPQAFSATTLADRSTKEWMVTTEVVHNFRDDVCVLLLKHPLQSITISPYPEVIKMNTKTGAYETVATNPGEVVAWAADKNGTVLMGVQRKSIEQINLIHREDQNGPWQVLTELSNNRMESPTILGFSPDGKGVYITTANGGGNKVLYRFDLVTHKLGEPLLEASGYDIGPSATATWSDQKNSLVGLAYYTDGPHFQCFDEEFTGSLAEIDRALPNTFNRPVGIADKDRRILVHSSSDRNPGAYYLFSTETKKLEPILRTRPWIKPEQMASMNPIVYTARDGVKIHGYLTIPLGQKPRSLPLVVLPHEGPLEFRDKWGFNPLVQMLANRGYAVLQMNYRGSAGYGSDFARSGEREAGGVIQRDIEDATRWAITKKVADPSRIAIVGYSRFGGFSALYAIGNSPGLYRCGITVNGFIDWFEVFESLTGPLRDFTRESFVMMVGDPKKDEDNLKAISPVNFAHKITSPVLFIYPKNDRFVTPGQIKGMIATSKKAGGYHEVLFLDDEANAEEQLQIKKFKAIEAFLAKHLGPAGMGDVAVPESLPEKK